MGKVNINQRIELDYKTSEAFKALRASLEHGYGDVKVIAFTSVMGKEGKSFVAFHTARTLAAGGKKCMYLNGNLREKDSNAVYEIERVSHTLLEYLEEKVEKKDVIYETDVDNLYLIEAGDASEHASELLGKKRFEELVSELHQEYEYVIVDTPALGEVADGLEIAHVCDGTILVVEPEVVAYEKAQKVKSMLEVSGCKILGVVLNK